MMNERIEKLMVNASSGACYDGNEPLLSGTEIEKFAELIVRECISALDDADGSVHHSECLLEHFGVNE
jgi:hypothetical protein